MVPLSVCPVWSPNSKICLRQLSFLYSRRVFYFAAITKKCIDFQVDSIHPVGQPSSGPNSAKSFAGSMPVVVHWAVRYAVMSDRLDQTAQRQE